MSVASGVLSDIMVVVLDDMASGLLGLARDFSPSVEEDEDR